MAKRGDSITIRGKRFEVAGLGDVGNDRFVEVVTPESHRFFAPMELWDAVTQDGSLLDDPAGRMENIVRSFGPSLPGAEKVEERQSFADELRALCNRYSAENGSDTPDFILAEFLVDCLTAFDRTVRHRERWYGRTRQSAWERSGFCPRTVGRARGETADEKEEPDHG